MGNNDRCSSVDPSNERQCVFKRFFEDDGKLQAVSLLQECLTEGIIVMIDRFIFVAMPLDCSVTFFQLIFPKIVPYEVIGIYSIICLLYVEEILICLLSASHPAGVILELIMVTVIDILDRCKETCALDTCRIQIFSNCGKRQGYILDTAMHVGIDNFRIHCSL